MVYVVVVVVVVVLQVITQFHCPPHGKLPGYAVFEVRPSMADGFALFCIPKYVTQFKGCPAGWSHFLSIPLPPSAPFCHAHTSCNCAIAYSAYQFTLASSNIFIISLSRICIKRGQFPCPPVPAPAKRRGCSFFRVFLECFPAARRKT